MSINRPRIYIAGPLNPHKGGGAIEYLRNCSRMIEAAPSFHRRPTRT